MKERIAIIDGLRSPIAKANGKLNDVSADTLGAIITKELVLRNDIDYKEFDEVIMEMLPTCKCLKYSKGNGNTSWISTKYPCIYGS